MGFEHFLVIWSQKYSGVIGGYSKIYHSVSFVIEIHKLFKIKIFKRNLRTNPKPPSQGRFNESKKIHESVFKCRLTSSKKTNYIHKLY